MSPKSDQEDCTSQNSLVLLLGPRRSEILKKLVSILNVEDKKDDEHEQSKSEQELFQMDKKWGVTIEPCFRLFEHLFSDSAHIALFCSNRTRFVAVVKKMILSTNPKLTFTGLRLGMAILEMDE
jgi:hypothetical protein